MSKEHAWQNRWLVTGTLTTISPLHIGGDLPLQKDIYPMEDKKKKETVEVSTVVTDFQNHAYIPAGTIKGNIRAWMEENGYADEAIEQIFGSPHDKKEGMTGGAIEFADAFAVEPVAAFKENPPYWDQERLTGVTASVAIDRVTRTASYKNLFHLEYVPAGVSFHATFTGQDVDEKYVKALVHALENGFNKTAKNPVTLGASTANGWGRFEWKQGKTRCMERKDVDAWIKNPMTGNKMLESLPLYDLRPDAKIEAKPDACLEITIKLMFDGPFFVNDQSKSKKVTGDKHKADFNPRRDTSGKVTLPAESFRGAFRFQAEKIIRTIDGKACTPRKPCSAITKKEDAESLCPACKVFGASGWRTALGIPLFALETCIDDGFRQDFVAVDRFTGGAKDGAKFDAMPVIDPVFSGTIRVDLAKIEPWGIGLLALTLRDLAEGDITFGYGAAKGYGACAATVDWKFPASSGVMEFSEMAKSKKLDFNKAGEWKETERQSLLEECIKELNGICKPKDGGNHGHA